MPDNKRAHTIFQRYGQLLAENKHRSGKLLSDTNRDLDQQRRIQEMEKKRRESMVAFQQMSKENQVLIEAKDKQVGV